MAGTALLTRAVGIVIVFSASGAAATTALAAAPAVSSSVARPGDCARVASGSWRYVPCGKKHNFEVAAVLRVPKKIDTGKPLDSAPAAWGMTKCTVRSVPRYIGTERSFSNFVPAVLRPTTRAWRAGNRTVVCGGVVREPGVGKWITTVGRFDAASGTPLCTTRNGRFSACVPGAVAYDRVVQLYRAAWRSPYPGAGVLMTRAREFGRSEYPAGTVFQVWGGFTRADWAAGFGRFARLGRVLE